MNDISDILRTMLDRTSRISDVEREFERMMDMDDVLRSDYVQWCREMGYETKSGYKDYLDELLEQRDSIWEGFDE